MLLEQRANTHVDVQSNENGGVIRSVRKSVCLSCLSVHVRALKEERKTATKV